METWPKIEKYGDLTVIEGVNNISFFVKGEPTKIFLKHKNFEDAFKIGKYRVIIKCADGQVEYGVLS